MKKIHDSDSIFSSENSKSISLRADNDLFNEENRKIVLPLLYIKRRESKDLENWEIIVNGEIIRTIKGTRFTKSEKKFLRTAKGMNFLINEYKNGKISVVEIKKELKKVLA